VLEFIDLFQLVLHFLAECQVLTRVRREVLVMKPFPVHDTLQLPLIVSISSVDVYAECK
jgi:hypothetical protein